MNLHEYYNYLKTVDWTASMSDDGGVARRGEAQIAKASKISRLSDDHKVLHDYMRDVGWGGKPKKPEEVFKEIEKIGTITPYPDDPNI